MSVSRVCVCVLGFHRSGTSLVTRLLNQLGVDLGPGEDLLEGVEGDNPNGYFEPRWTIAINDAILAAFGGSYEAPPELPAGWAQHPELDALRATARERLAAAFAGSTLWGIKDPRLSLTLPFWRPLIAEHADDLRFVVCVRSPAETAASMLRRDIYGALDAEHFGRAWLAYTAGALANSGHGERTLALYDDLLADPEHESAPAGGVHRRPAALRRPDRDRRSRPAPPRRRPRRDGRRPRPVRRRPRRLPRAARSAIDPGTRRRARDRGRRARARRPQRRPCLSEPARGGRGRSGRPAAPARRRADPHPPPALPGRTADHLDQ